MSATPAPAPGAPVPGAAVYAKAPTQVLGRRALALIIDAIIVAALLSPITITSWHTDNGTLHITYSALGYLAVGLAPVLYWWILESAFGATVGKFICGIRVVSNDGSRAGVGQCFVRNIIRIVPFYWLVGWIVALASGPRRTRTFDMLANTLVVRATYAEQQQPQALPQQPQVPQAQPPQQ
jgi:uncharacterized RDD family membrane protein YckC